LAARLAARREAGDRAGGRARGGRGRADSSARPARRLPIRTKGGPTCQGTGRTGNGPADQVKETAIGIGSPERSGFGIRGIWAAANGPASGRSLAEVRSLQKRLTSVPGPPLNLSSSCVPRKNRFSGACWLVGLAPSENKSTAGFRSGRLHKGPAKISNSKRTQGDGVSVLGGTMAARQKSFGPILPTDPPHQVVCGPRGLPENSTALGARDQKQAQAGPGRNLERAKATAEFRATSWADGRAGPSERAC